MVPAAGDDLTFGDGTLGTIQLNGNQTANSLTFDSSFTLGAFGTSNLLTNTSGNISVLTGITGTINASYAGTNGITLSGGGTLFLNHPAPTFGGNITVDGTGTTLMFNPRGLPVQVANTNTVTLNGRQDFPTLGVTAATRTITLSNGGELKLIGTGANPDGSTKNIVLGTGGGAINVAAGYQVLQWDDASQIGGSGSLTKNGTGRIIVTGQDYGLTGNMIVNAGVMGFERLTGASTTAGTRFSALAAAAAITANGGLMMFNNGTVGRIDNAITFNGGTIGVNGAAHIFGNDTAGPVVGWTLNSGNFLLRDAFGPGTSRLPLIRTQLGGSGTINLIQATGNAPTGRLVLERGDLTHTFSGTWNVPDLAILESNPRNGVGGGPTLTGNTLGPTATVNLSGFGALLDMRDHGSGSNQIFNTGAANYTGNNITVTSTDAGARPTILGQRGGATNTGNTFNFAGLTVGSQRLIVSTNDSYRWLFNNLTLTGSPQFEVTTASISSLNIAGAVSAPTQTITKLRDGIMSFGAAVNSNIAVTNGTVNLIGASGTVTGTNTITVNGGGFQNAAAGVLILDNLNALPGITAGANNDRVGDSVTVNTLSNSTVRLISPNNSTASEILGGTVNVTGHTTFDVVKTGTATAPVALQLGNTAYTLNPNATVNYSGTTLGGVGNNSSRIIIPGQATVAFLGAQHHQSNEWVRYDGTADSGFALGVIQFAAADYGTGLNAAETAWASGMHVKQTGATGITLTANRSIDTLNTQFSAANQAVNVNGNTLTVERGGIISGVNTAGLVGNAGVGAITAGTGDAPASLIIHNSATLDIKVPISDHLGADGMPGGGDDQPVTLVKSGTGELRLTHHSLSVGGGVAAAAPFTTSTWTGAFTGGVVINDGTLNVHRGQFLNGQTITMNGGALEINHPVSNANAHSVLPGWGNNFVINGNARIGIDDNGESDDNNSGDNTLAPLGTLTINGSHVLGISGWIPDISFTGASFSGRPTLNTGLARNAATAVIIGGVISGNGFDMVAYGTTPSPVILGGGSADSANSTYATAINAYGGTLRLNKANNSIALADTPASDDLVINGGALNWGPGPVGNVAVTNNNFSDGLVPTSPGSAMLAGQHQIADTATVTLLTGSVGQSDRINNDKWGTLNQKNGTLNVGLGTMEVDVANISGGAFGINNGATFKAGALNLQAGAYNPGITTGMPGNPAAVTTLEIGAAGLSMAGQTITLGSGGSANYAGAGARLILGGNITATEDPMNGVSFDRQGIYVQTGNSFRELGASRIELTGSRTITIDPDIMFFITPRMTGSGGIVKAGGGGLALASYDTSDFTGAVVVNDGALSARGPGSLGTSAGGVTINAGGTLKLENGWEYGDAFTVSGAGAFIPNSGVREVGALVSGSGTNRITGAVSLGADATIGSAEMLQPTAQPAGSMSVFTNANLILSHAAGVTGTGTLTLSGHGDGSIAGGLNTSSGGLEKDGAGRWTIGGAGTYGGITTVEAGYLRITNGAALGLAAAGTTVFGGASLEVAGGITSAEPLTLNGAGTSPVGGAVVNVGGANVLSGAVTLGTDTTLQSDAGSLTLSNTVSGAGRGLTLGGTGSGAANGAVNVATILKTDTGTWTLGGNNAVTGATTVAGGTLALNYTVNNGSKVSSVSLLTLAGGDLSVNGNAVGTSQTIGGLDLGSGGGNVTVTSSGAATTLNINGITRLSGGTVNFVLPASGAIATSTPLDNGIIGGYATVGGQDWATVSGGNVAAFTGYSPLATATATDNALTGAAVRSAATNVNSLKITSEGGLNIGTNPLTVNSGGILYTGSSNAAIVGSGAGLVSDTATDELIIHTPNGPLDISAPLIGAGTGSLTKEGAGSLFLSGASAFTGSININGGTLGIIGLGSTHPTALGAQTGIRDINVNGGTFNVIGDYNFNITSGANMRLNVGQGGGTLSNTFNSGASASGVLLDDANEFTGSGDLTITGGGRVTLGAAAVAYPTFTGNVNVDRGILVVQNAGGAGGRQEQTITLRSGSALINIIGAGAGVIGLPNNIVMEGGAELYNSGADRAYTGNIQLSGTNTIALIERDNVVQNRQMHLMGRISGTGVTLNVFGSTNGSPLYLGSGSNDFTGTINLNPNVTLEARMPGSLGVAPGAVTVNINGGNSRLLLRHYTQGDYLANVVMNGTSILDSNTLTNLGTSTSPVLSINNLTIGSDGNAQFQGGNAFTTRVAGSATVNSSPAGANLNITTGLLLENGLTFATPGNVFDKRGAGALIMRGGSNHTGTVLVQGGMLQLRGSNGALPTSSSIEVRGGELRIENGDAVNTTRLNQSGTLVLGGGALRVNGDQTLPTTTAVAGNTTVVYNLSSDSVASALTLTGFTRSTGATVQFQTPDIGGPVGQTSVGQVRVSSRILIPGQADTTQTIPGLLGNNGIDFIQYDGTTTDSGAVLGVRDMRNPGSTISPSNYTDNAAETAWTDAVILRRTNATDNTVVTYTLTANRALDAIKIETGGTNRDTVFDLGAFNLRIEGGGILDVSATTHDTTFNGTTGVLTAGPATPGANTAELIIGGTDDSTVINAIVGNNGTQAVALVKTGTGTLNLTNSGNSYTGNTFVNQGQINVNASSALGAAANTINLSGGTLSLNVGDANSSVALTGFGQNVVVHANSTLVTDNGALAGTDNDYSMGQLVINGPYTLGLRGFDSQDLTFTGGASFTGMPTLDLAQVTSGSPNTFYQVGGAITGSGFYVSSSGNVDNTAAGLQIGTGAADTTANTYSGKLILLPGNFNDDLRVQLNKAAGTTAITGDIEMNGGVLSLLANDQIADTSNLVLNNGLIDFNDKNETIASVTMRGGSFGTDGGGGATANVVTVTGDFDATGVTSFVNTNGVTVNSSSHLVIGGTLRLNGFSRGTIGSNGAASMTLGGLEMQGTVITINGGTNVGLIRLNGDVATLQATIPSTINSLENDNAVELNGTRTFNIADGGSGIDFVLSAQVRNSTAPVATGGIIKTGAGVMQLQGGTAANTFTGPTNVNEGTLVLNKTAGTAALGAGALTIGDGIGGAEADKLIIRLSNQINDAANVTVNSSGLLDLGSFNTSEQIASLAGAGQVDVGPGSVLTVSGTTSTEFSGSIQGGGGLTKGGASILELSGDNDYVGATTINAGSVIVNGSIEGSITTVNTGGTLGGTGSVGDVVIATGGSLAPGESPGTLATGTVNLQSGATLKIEIGGLVAGDNPNNHDQVIVTGGITLAGNLQGSLINGFIPAINDTFYIMLNDGVDAVSGTFNGLAEGAIVSVSGLDFTVTYTANGDAGAIGNDVALVAQIPEPGSLASLLGGMATLIGLQRFRRRRSA